MPHYDKHGRRRRTRAEKRRWKAKNFVPKISRLENDEPPRKEPR